MPDSKPAILIVQPHLGVLGPLFEAEFTVWRFQGERSTSYVGRYHYRLVVVDGSVRIRSKRAVLANTSLRQVSDVAIIL